ncbi:MAG TPA: hypothetical protein VIW68_03115 [Candidatus Sulfotelmatobacter sp.]
MHYAGFCVGGVSIQLAGADRSAIALVPSLEAFRSHTGGSDISIQVEWADDFGRPKGRRLFDSGSVWKLYEDGASFQFDFSASILDAQPYKRLVVDRQFQDATLQLNHEVFEAYPSVAPLDYPLDELLIMHRLTQEKAIELHGCGIVRADGNGNLFVGHSGAGKSTTTRLWTEREDVEVLSDDRIIVRRDEGVGSGMRPPFEAARGADEHEVLRLRDCSASRGNRFAQDDKKTGMRMYGTPWHGEAMYASPGSAMLRRIFILEHGCGNALTPLSPSQAVGELFARSFVPFHRHEYVDSALQFLQELVDAVPCYRYAFEPDQRAVDTILNLQD